MRKQATLALALLLALALFACATGPSFNQKVNLVTDSAEATLKTCYRLEKAGTISADDYKAVKAAYDAYRSSVMLYKAGIGDAEAVTAAVQSFVEISSRFIVLEGKKT